MREDSQSVRLDGQWHHISLRVLIMQAAFVLHKEYKFGTLDKSSQVSLQKQALGWAQWLIPIIPVLWEAEVGR